MVVTRIKAVLNPDCPGVLKVGLVCMYVCMYVWMYGCMDVCGLPADAAVQCPGKKKGMKYSACFHKQYT